MLNSVVTTLKVTNEDFTQSQEFKDEMRKYEQMIKERQKEKNEIQISLKEFEEKLKENMPAFVKNALEKVEIQKNPD